MKLLVKPLCIVFCSFLFSTSVYAVNPIGVLDRADATIIYGWAKDDDYNPGQNGSKPILVHIYVDGQFVGQIAANQWRADIGQYYGFSWPNPPAFGPGSHIVKAFVLGVDTNGNLDGENIELNSSPRTIIQPVEYALTSSDGQIIAAVDSRYGGSISKIIDSVNFPNQNLVIDENGGSLLQPAFWIQPWHELPFGCTTPRGDLYYRNPTLGGYYSDSAYGYQLGNPIGIFGNVTNPSTFDPEEFIRYEDNGKTIHFKSRFVRHDYCATIDLPMANQSMWDTTFYLESWVSFDVSYPNTIKSKYKVTNIGEATESTSAYQLPILFAWDMTRAAYWKNGQKQIINLAVGNLNATPDQNWAALIGTNREAGVGFVVTPRLSLRPNLNLFGGNCMGAGCSPNSNGKVASVMDIHAPILTTLGPTSGVTYNVVDGFTYISAGASFEWTVYFPVGTLLQIKQNSEAILQNEDFGFIDPTPNPTPTPIPTPTPTPPPAFSINDLKGLLTNYVGLLESGYDIYPIDEKINMLDMGYVAKYQIN